MPELGKSQQPVLSVENLHLDLYSGREISAKGLIQGVSLNCYPGECLALIGESGCGKSLTAMSILGLLPKEIRVSAGAISLRGREITRLEDGEWRSIRGLDIGAIFQDPMNSLNPSMKVGYQIAESRMLHLGESRRRAVNRAVEIMEIVGIPDPKNRSSWFPHEFSGGMQQRLMIAAAIACDPALLIADEPTTALDVTVQSEILELFQTLREDNEMAVLLVTHDLGVVAEVADRVAVMYAGHIVEQSDVSVFFSDPLHPYSSALLRSVPKAESAYRMLEAIGGIVPSAKEMPDGCRFAPRCDRFIAGRCDHGMIPVVEIDGRKAKCVNLPGPLTLGVH